MKALFIGAHTDEELCFAGAMQKYDAHYVAFSHCGNPDLEIECEKSLDILGVKSRLIQDVTVREFHLSCQIPIFLYTLSREYDTVFTHSIIDRHPDHRFVARESKRIFNCNLFTYIGPWNGNEKPNYFIELSEQQLEKKIAALSCYKSQSHRPYMSPEFIRSQAIYNGVKCGKRYAEAFRIEKLIN